MMMLCLAVVAAVALVGSASAQADDEVVLCAKDFALCPLENQYPSGTLVKFRAVHPAFSGGLAEECNESILHLDTLAQMGLVIPVTILGWSFTGCAPCTTVEVNGLPRSGELKVEEEAGQDVYWLLTSFEATVKGGFFCFGNTCKFKASHVVLPIHNTADGHPLLLVGFSLELVSGGKEFCGTGGKFTTEYSVTEPLYRLSLYLLP